MAPVVGLAGSAPNKDFLLLNALAMPVRAWDKSYQTPAAIVVVKAASNVIKPCRCRSRRVSILALELGCLEKVKPGYAAAQPAIDSLCCCMLCGGVVELWNWVGWGLLDVSGCGYVLVYC